MYSCMAYRRGDGLRPVRSMELTPAPSQGEMSARKPIPRIWRVKSFSPSTSPGSADFLVRPNRKRAKLAAAPRIHASCWHRQSGPTSKLALSGLDVSEQNIAQIYPLRARSCTGFSSFVSYLFDA